MSPRYGCDSAPCGWDRVCPLASTRALKAQECETVGQWCQSGPPRGDACASETSRDSPAPPCGWRPTCEWLADQRLTFQERRVATLLAQRFTNKEIARALGRSLRTAEHAVERTLGKLCVGRRQVARLLASTFGGMPASWPRCITISQEENQVLRGRP
jgi:DNA-binding CsgD family transcriptional regulator